KRGGHYPVLTGHTLTGLGTTSTSQCITSFTVPLLRLSGKTSVLFEPLTHHTPDVVALVRIGMIGTGNGLESQVMRGLCQLREHGGQALKGHHRLRFRRPDHDQQWTLDVGDMPQNVILLLRSILFDKNLGSDQQGYGIEGVDQGIWLATVKMLLRLGRKALELLAGVESGIGRIRKPGW